MFTFNCKCLTSFKCFNDDDFHAVMVQCGKFVSLNQDIWCAILVLYVFTNTIKFSNLGCTVSKLSSQGDMLMVMVL